jgi:hypothetical protein
MHASHVQSESKHHAQWPCSSGDCARRHTASRIAKLRGSSMRKTSSSYLTRVFIDRKPHQIARCFCSRRTHTAGSRGRFAQCRDSTPTTSHDSPLASIIAIVQAFRVRMDIPGSGKPDEEVQEATWTRQSECGSTGE